MNCKLSIVNLAFDSQDEQFARAFNVLREGIAAQAFPGAACAVVRRGTLVALAGLGRFTYDADSQQVAANTIYDLASVTKVVATTPMCMLLYERGLIALESPIAQLVPEFVRGHNDQRRQQVTVRMLLAHSSGLPAYVRLFEQLQGRQEIIEAACRVPLVHDPCTRAEYSDIGFIILGEALSRVAGERVDRFCGTEVFAPLEMSRTGFCPPANLQAAIPPTELVRGRALQGEVNDENASAMGGVAGHAGVFGSAGDLARFAQCMLAGGAPILKGDTIARFTKREPQPAGTSRALGWDTPSEPSQSGQHLSASSYGHLGFTGTSLWIDPEKQLAIVLLTNRTWPDRRSQLTKEFRPRFHDAAVECIRDSE
jgi:serine-type D-Ala-D-Ala carboxypeptidase